MESAADGSILTSTWYEGPQPDKHAGDEWGPHTPSTPIVWDEKSGSLLQVEIPDSSSRNDDEIELKMSLLSMYGMFPPTLQFSGKADGNSFLGIPD